MIKTVLIDVRTPESVLRQAVVDFTTADVLGLDCEAEDSNKHAGLAKIGKKKFTWDFRRSVMTGFSFHKQGTDVAYYVNMNHADVENRMPEAFIHALFAQANPKTTMVAHNAPFEISSFRSCYGIELTQMVCSMQLAVTHHGPDNYDQQRFLRTPLNNIRPLIPNILDVFEGYDSRRDGRDMTSDQSFVFGQFIGKESDAAHSYNGFVKSLAYSFALKKLIKQIFGEDMSTFKETLDGAAHMGELTGDQVVAYGADDAYQCVRIYQYLLDDLMRKNPQALVTFIEQENPMIYVFADTKSEGIRLDLGEIQARRSLERQRYAQLIRDTKKAIKALLPFPAGPVDFMIEHQSRWYPNNWANKRKQIENWANSPESLDDYETCTEISNPIGNAWSDRDGDGRFNLLHYYSMRIILHDLLGHNLVRVGGKIASDAEARGRMVKTFEKSGETKKVELLNLFTKLSNVEQIMKLYITPYLNLIDPDTGRVYPTINSMLASRRMAMQDPNGTQMAKRGEASYVRSFIKSDTDNHVVLSADWSSVELVLIGEYSGDKEFARVFGQIPYGDLHTGAAADCLGLNESDFVALKRGNNPGNIPLVDLDGMPMTDPSKFFKLMRTEIGKGANFNYWYSGALGTIGEVLGWSSETMWDAVDRYRNRFPEAEEWRVKLREEVQRFGYITLPDGHRRERFEATNEWAVNIARKFASVNASAAMQQFAAQAIKTISARACNQGVNTMIQGSCAGMAKRAILETKRTMNHKYARFMKPIHDELVYSVDKDYVLEFIPILRKAMNTQPVFVKNLPLDCMVAIGKTFGVKDQIELDEAPLIEGVVPKEYVNQRLPDNIIQNVIDYIMEK